MTSEKRLLKFEDAAELVRETVLPQEALGQFYVGLEHIQEGTLHLTGYGYAEDVNSTKSKFRKGDILFGKLRPYFRKVVLAPFDGICSTDIWVIRAKNGLNQKFLFYWMASQEFIDEAMRGSEGTRMPRAKWDFVARQTSFITDLEEQKAIAHILSALDDKIELNQQMNRNLEAIAQAIFKSWFVDFDPVRAKMEGREPEGMDTATAALFPDSFEDSQLGEIPQRWRVVSLPEVIEVNPRRSLSKEEIAPYLDMQNMPTQGHRPNAWIDRPFSSGTKFKNGDTLLARITPCLENGKTAFVDFLEDGQVGWGSTEYIIFRPKPPLPVEHGYYLARSEELRAYAIQNMTGSSGRQRVPAECFQQYLIVIPQNVIARCFGDLTKPLMATIKATSEQSCTLTAIRDALLPKLISGEIRVKEAEKVLEDVA